MAFKPQQKQFKSINDNEYTFQTVPNSIYLKILDKSTSSDGKPLLHELYPAILEHIVVVPNSLTVDDFEDFQELADVCENALTFQQG